MGVLGVLSTLFQDQGEQDKVGSGRGPKGTEGEQAPHSQVFISGHHTVLPNLSRNIQVLPVHFKTDVNFHANEVQPSSFWQLATAASALAPSSSCFMGNHWSSHSTRGGEFPCMSCMKMALHTAVLPRAKGLCSQLFTGAFSSLLSLCKNWIYGIKTIGCFGKQIRCSHEWASDNP